MTNMEWLVAHKINLRDLYVSSIGKGRFAIKDYNAIVYSEFESSSTTHSDILVEWLSSDYQKENFLSKTDKKLMTNWLGIIRSFTWDNITGVALTRFDADGNVVLCFDDDEKVEDYYMVFNFQNRHSIKFLTSDNDFKRMKWNKTYSLYDLDMTGVDADLEREFENR